MNNKEEIEKILKEHPNRYAFILKRDENAHLLVWLKRLFPLLLFNGNNLNTFLYWLIHDIHDFPRCVYCGKPILCNVKSIHLYKTHCSRRCASCDPNTILKVQNTNMLKFGVPCTLLTLKSWDAIHKSCLEKYGAENIWASDYGKRRCKETRYLRYNGKYESELSSNKRKNTIILRFGGITGNIFGTLYGKEKIKLTIFKKTGFYYQNQSDSAREKLRQIMFSKEVQQKRMDTLKRNNTFNKSKPEDDCYNMLLFIFPHIVRLYKCERYPFYCDFYDPDSDTFFEYNGSWTHGGHTFNWNSLDDVNKLNCWKQKHTAFYDTAIKVWSVSDPLKLRTAQINNLKYVIFWNINDVVEYVMKYFTTV